MSDNEYEGPITRNGRAKGDMWELDSHGAPRESESEPTNSKRGSRPTETAPAGPSTEEILRSMAMMMKHSQEEADRRWREADKREERRIEEAKLEEESRAREAKKEEERKKEEAELQWNRMEQLRKADAQSVADRYEDEQRRKDARIAAAAAESKVANALKTFPKISSPTLLAAQLSNYAKLMKDLDAPEDVLKSRLPEILSGSVAVTYQNVCTAGCETFDDVRRKLLTAAGITFSSAGRAFMKPDVDALKKLSAVDLWCHVKGVAERMLDGAKDTKMAVSALSVIFLNSIGSGNLILKLAGCDPLKDESIIEALYSTYEAFGCVLGSGGQSSDVRRVGNRGPGKCEHCQRSGHLSKDCWSKPVKKPLVCYACQKEGHISSKCPEKNTDSKSESAPKGGSGDKKRVWNKNCMVSEMSHKLSHGDESMMLVEVGGKSLKVLPDSGAQVSVVPSAFVAEREYSKETTCLVDFEGQGDRRRRIAHVDIEVGETVFHERVAVSDHLGPAGILSLPICDRVKAECILSEYYRQKNSESINAVQTRAGKRALEEEAERERTVMAEDCADLRVECGGVLGMNGEDLVGLRSEGSVMHGNSVSSSLGIAVSEDSVDACVESHPESEPRKVSVAVRESSVDACVEKCLESTPRNSCIDVPVSIENTEVEMHEKSATPNLSNNVPVSREVASEITESDVGSKTACTETCSRLVGAETRCEYAQLDCLRGGSDRTDFIELIKSDSTLAACRRLASQRERGYMWDKGLLIHKSVTEVGEEIQRLVVPKQKRELICKLAHDRMGHLGHRKLREIVGKSFTWPMIGTELEAYVKSCQSCQATNKRGQRKVPMIERPILSEPFEAVAIDIVGPFPMAKGRFRYLLTSVCLATRWPEVVTLRTVTAKAVADGLVSIFSHTGLPYLILCDNGSQFTGKIMKELAEILGIAVKHSSPYHPESNGMIERMHATLSSMLRKAGERQLDWAEQVPFALFALRQMPCRTTGLSPYELVWGSKMRTPLDVLYRGWREKVGDSLNVSEWTLKLCDKLDVLRDIAVSNAKLESAKRKDSYDRGKSVRSYELGDKVLVRVAGLNGKLADSWEGPYEVCKILSSVNYKVRLCGEKKYRKVHVNLCKTYQERKRVAGVTMLAHEDDTQSSHGAKLSGEVVESALREVKVVLGDYTDIMDGEPGRFTGNPLSVSVVDGAEPVSTKPYRIPEAVKPKVKDALDNLIERGWVVPSNSPWASPIVPVAKPDGSVRLCINYKRVNDLTCQQQYPIPHFEEILAEVGQAEVLSKMDLMKGYHQVPLTPDCQDLTGFVTPWGCFKFTVLPFGLKNAPAQFQQLMVEVLEGCKGFALVYIDDVLVFSKKKSQHAVHVRQVLEAVRASGLKLNPKKCTWAKDRVEFLGHVVGAGKVSVPAARVMALRNFVKPVTRKDLRAALGTFGYYRKFIPNYASYTSELHRATSTKSPNKVVWTREMTSDFCELKSIICNVSELVVPCEGDVFVLHTDASGRGIGAVLYVRRDGEELPVAFFSKPVRGAEVRYSATELEALAILRSVEHFVPYLYGRSFEVVTDHAPLCGLMTSPHLNRRLRGFMLKLLEFDFTIAYRPGEENTDADGLSRQAWEVVEDSSSSGGSLLVPANIIEGGDVGTPPKRSKEKKRREKEDEQRAPPPTDKPAQTSCAGEQ